MDIFKPITLEDMALFTDVFKRIKPIASNLLFLISICGEKITTSVIQ